MKKKIILTLLILLFNASSSFSADKIVKGRGIFQIDVDVATFYGNDSLNYIEMYYGIRENVLSYKIDSSRIIGAANVRFEVRNDTGVVAKKEWTVPHIIEDTMQLEKNQTMTGLESFGLPIGNYTLAVVAYDIYDPNRKDTLVVPLLLRAYSARKEALSDIELCTSIQSSSNKQSMFYKNTLEVIPNPSRLYGMGVPILYHYLEAYNLMHGENNNGLIVRTSVIDAMGKEVIVHDKPKSGLLNSSVEIGTVNVTSLKGGTYLLRISLLDSANTSLATSTKKFFVYKPQMNNDTLAVSPVVDVTRSEYAVMSDSEIDQEFSYAKYISTDIERRQYQQLNGLDAKRKFLFDFWRRRNPDPLTMENKFKEDYKKRVADANKDFTHALREGWKTEQGRVFIIYGQADEVERSPSSSDSNPYEIWHYQNIQGGVIFVFVDRTGFGDYVLVHSTHRDEIHDNNWLEEYAQKMH